MAQVTVVVNGRSFRLGCRDGEESRVQTLAAEIDGHIQRICGKGRPVQDERLFLMAAILVADQLSESRDELLRLQRQLSEARAYHVIEGGANALQRELNRAVEGGGKVECLHPRPSATA